MKKTLLPLISFFLILLLGNFSLIRAEEPTVESLLSQVTKALEGKEMDAYLDAFPPQTREIERGVMAAHFESFGMESVMVKIAGRQTDADGTPRASLQLLFQKSYAAMVEVWQLSFGRENNRWWINDKSVNWSIANLYKIRIPSDKIERVAGIEISHADIRLSFDEALVFYDNIPGLETALLVIGKGHFRFAPSVPAEKHQLQLIYKKTVLDDRLEYAFIRCSDSFFKSRIVIRPKPSKPDFLVTRKEKNKAAEVFLKSYPHSFTIQNSMNGELLSSLPQGEDAVFIFKGKKTGQLAYIHSQFAEEEVNFFDLGKERIVNLYSPQKEGEPKRRKFSISTNETFDIQSYQIEADYSPAKSYLSAMAKIEFSSRSGLLKGMQFRFNPDLEIVRVHDARKRDLFFTADDLRKYLYVYFIDPLNQGESTWIEVYYRGRIIPVSPTTDVIGQTGINNGVYIFNSKPKYKTALFTHSTLWYPSSPRDDYFTSRFKIIVPPEYACISNGELIEQGKLEEVEEVAEIEKTGHSYFTFQTRSPVKQLAFLIGKFDTFEQGNDPVPIESVCSSDVMGQRRSKYAEAGDILRNYIRWFGPYPFEKLSIVQRLWASDGGHSPAGFTILNLTPQRVNHFFTMDRMSPVDLSRWKEYFLAHEIAHQWWGQGVSWTSYRDQWLSEGMAQFAAALYLRERYGETAYASILKKFSKWTEKTSFRGPIIFGSRLSYFNFEAYQAIIYNKSALALNMLRDLLGDDVFFKGLRAFYMDHRYNPAGTGQFRAAMEKASGSDLKPFFQGWFFSHELPDVKVSWTVDKSEDEKRLSVKIQQLNEVFVFPLWIEWQVGDQIFREKIFVDSGDTIFTAALSEKPSFLRVNPDHAVPGKFK